MPSSLFFPLDQIRPSQILSQYSEWVYFTLALVFFISVAGIALRRHFDRPYVKPLIISVGLMLTVGVFVYKDWLKAIIEGWGILGTVILFAMAGVIPFGLCRGFGMPAPKAFYLSYIMLYILSWLKFSQVYEVLGERNLGIVNLGLLALFIFSVFKVVKLSRPKAPLGQDLVSNSPVTNEISQEIGYQASEKKVLKRQAEKVTKIEVRSIKDIMEFLARVQQAVETHANTLPREERERIARILGEISKREDLLRKGQASLKHTLEQTRVIDSVELEKLKKRLSKAQGKEREILAKEIDGEEEKIKAEKRIIELEGKLNVCLGQFNNAMALAVEAMKSSTYPLDAKPHLVQARIVLVDIKEILDAIKSLEERLIGLSRNEKKLLEKERKAA